MDKRVYHGWRMYRCQIMCDGEIGVNHLGRPKWFPTNCPLNSTWITREEAARTLRLERNFEPQEPTRTT